MTSAKTWYCLGLGVLVLSFLSSGTGRSALSHASAYVSCARARMLPYVGMVEMAFGRTQSGFGHMHANVEQLQARANAAQARIEARRAQIEAAQAMLQDRRIQRQMRRAQEMVNNRRWMDQAVVADQVIAVPPVPVVARVPDVPSVEVTSPAAHVVVCPGTRMHVAVPAVNVSVDRMQEPI